MENRAYTINSNKGRLLSGEWEGQPCPSILILGAGSDHRVHIITRGLKGGGGGVMLGLTSDCQGIRKVPTTEHKPYRKGTASSWSWLKGTFGRICVETANKGGGLMFKKNWDNKG